jgi:hypothetical protein
MQPDERKLRNEEEFILYSSSEKRGIRECLPILRSFETIFSPQTISVASLYYFTFPIKFKRLRSPDIVTKGCNKATSAEIKFMRRIAGYSLLDHIKMKKI